MVLLFSVLQSEICDLEPRCPQICCVQCLTIAGCIRGM